MAIIRLTTFIQAPQQRVFDLSRSIDLHKTSLDHTGEQAIAGITSGLIALNESVTWQANHLFKNRIFKSRITAMKPYSFFTDEMEKGDFKSVSHQHLFEATNEGTIMNDIFCFESPYGLFGKLFNQLFLLRYLTRLLKTRNEMIKHFAESDKWKEVLPS